MEIEHAAYDTPVLSCTKSLLLQSPALTPAGDGEAAAVGAEITGQDAGPHVFAAAPTDTQCGDKTLSIEIQDKVTDGDKTLEPQVPFPGGAVTITAPGEWAPAKRLPGVDLAKTAASWTRTVPAGVRSAQIVSR